MSSQNFSEVAKSMGKELGFDWVSISPALPLEEERKHYQDWCAKGYAAELSYMIRESPRRWVPQDLLPEAKSVISFAVSYHSLFPVAPQMQMRRGFGRVARYAWGKDYHLVLRKRLEEWVRLFSEASGKKFKSKILVDSAPFLERAYANQSGVGFVGKNTLWIHRKLGSFVFLAEVLTDLELEVDSSSVIARELNDSSNLVGIATASPQDDIKKNRKDPCGSCRECLGACPTGALVNARELDARKCISYWTIEHRGEIPEEMRRQIGDWIFGCDICQEVCPYNGLRPQTKWKEFLPESGSGPFLSLREVLTIQTEEEFKKKFAETPILRAKRAGLIRNACVVCANQNFTEAIPELTELQKNDPDPVIRSHALWALGKITRLSLSRASP